MPRKPAGPSSATTKPRVEKDAELELMRLIWRKLAVLETDARRRVCEYLANRCDDPIPAQATLEFEAGGRAE